MAEEFLRVNNISKHFAGVRALDNVSFVVNQGEIRCLVGENGSGKSTLIKVIAGVYPPTSGEVTINGQTYRSLRPITSIQEGIQVIYQDFSLFPNLTAAENIALNYQLERGKRFINWGEVRRIARDAIAQIDVDVDLNAIVGDLPVADRQLIAITRALLHDAKLIIMDEPTTALTQREVESLFRVIRGLRQKGISILFVSHKLSEVQSIADTIMVLRNGKKVADGLASEFDLVKLAYHMTGREIMETGYRYNPTAHGQNGNPPLLRVNNLSLPGRFEDVSFEVRSGEIVGVTGLLGSGRTDLALALFGVQPAISGETYVNGRRVHIGSIQDAMRHGIGYVPEDRLTEGLFLAQSIGRNVVVRIIDQTLGRAGLLSSRKMTEKIREWTKRLSIKTADVRNAVSSLSGGNQQRVVLAKWLAASPQILVMNGPTVGVDVGSKMELHELIKELAGQGIGILIMSDDLPELMNTCNRILLMREGRIVEEFQTTNITEEQLNLKLTEAVE